MSDDLPDIEQSPDDQSSKAKGFAWIILAIVIGVGCAVGISPLVRTIPWSWEKKMAKTIPAFSSENICPGNAATDELLKRLKARLYPLGPEDEAMPIEIQIVDRPEVNAYAGLGGKIIVNEGLLDEAQSAEEVAGVLAHEIEHVHRRHILEGALTHFVTDELIQVVSTGDVSSDTEWAHYFLRMGFSRSQEAEADEGGLRRLQKAHIDNQGFRQFFERMKKSETVPAFLSDHPSGKSRFNMVKEFENKNTMPIMTHAEWLQLQAYCR